MVKLATFRSSGREKIGLVHSKDSRLFDLAVAADRSGKSNPAFASMLNLIDAGPAALDHVAVLFESNGTDAALSIDVAAVEILAPIPEPRQMRDGMSFPLHILQAPRGQLKLAARAKNDMAELARIDAEPLGELPEVYRKQPIYYITNRFSVRGPNTTVKWPRYSTVMDYELEFGIITKNKGANITAAMSWGRGSSRQMKLAILTNSRWKPASTARCARSASTKECFFRLRRSSPTSQKTKP